VSTKETNVLIEKRGILALKNVLLATGRIDPQIEEDSTKISWDGTLLFWDSREKFGEKDCAGRIPVQVKSTDSPKFKNGLLRYSGVSLIDLKNYKQDGGCLYFVIDISSQTPSIYYELLLPYELEKTLSIKRPANVKTTTLYLNRFPESDGAISALMHLFLSERNKQVSTAGLTFDIQNLDERAKKLLLDLTEKGIAPFSFSMIGTVENPFKNSFEIPTYF